MATLSSAGIGSGLDVNGIVTQLMALERRPVTQLQTTTARYETQLSAFGKLQAAMTTLRDASRKLTDAGTWTSTTVASSNTAAISASSTGLAPPGSYSVGVTNLAAAQTLVSDTTFAAATDSVGSGSLTIELGSWSAGPPIGFNAKAGATPVTVTIAAGSDSLAAVRDAINSANAGVTASIVNDATGARLSLRSTTTGEANAFRITVADDDGLPGDASGLSQLAYDPSTPSASQMQRRLAAANANATINGVPISSATNMLTDVIDGLTVRLSQVTTSNIDLTVDRDNVAIKKSVTEFSTAYNDLLKLMREQTRFDESSKKAGTLQGDRTAVSLISQLRTLVGSNTAANATFARLTDIGLEPQSDGMLKVNDTKLDAAVGRLDDLKQFFARNEVGTESDGVGVLMRDFGTGLLSTGGVLSTRQEGLRGSIQRNKDGVTRLEERLALTEKRLREQYSRLDTNIAKLSSLQNYVNQQITNWNKSTG